MTRFSSFFEKTNRRLYPVVVAVGVFGAKNGLLPARRVLCRQILPESDFFKPVFTCYNCYNSFLKWIKVSIVKDLTLLQAAENCRSLLQVVTNLLHFVTKVCYKVVTGAKYWYSIIYKRCNKCYKCNRKKLVSRKFPSS